MKYLMISIKDSKIGFGGIRLVSNEAVARRDFEMMFKDTNDIYYNNARDFSLYSLGTFDSVSGSFDLEPTPKFLFDGSEFIA
ncbi:MAG: nonstructural protein [Microviridae sp.]|nr:MAG: nonstructural protein [Microviridae sp.]